MFLGGFQRKCHDRVEGAFKTSVVYGEGNRA